MASTLKPHKSGGADIAAWRLPLALKARLKGSRLSEGSSLKGNAGPASAQAFNDLGENISPKAPRWPCLTDLNAV